MRIMGKYWYFCHELKFWMNKKTHLKWFLDSDILHLLCPWWRQNNNRTLQHWHCYLSTLEYVNYLKYDSFIKNFPLECNYNFWGTLDHTWLFLKLRSIRVVEGVRFHRMSKKRDNQMIMLDCLHKRLLSEV